MNRAKRQRASTGGDPKELLAFAKAQRSSMIEAIRRMVEQESPSFDKAAVDRAGEQLAEEFSRRGERVQFHRSERFGNHLQADFAGTRGDKPVLLLGHFDTVWDVGTLATMPFREKDGRLWGPGVLDMKAGIAQILFAVDALTQIRGALPRPVTVLLVSDEEVGSESSRAIIESLAKRSSAVLVLEPSFGPEGALKTARKGVGDYLVKVYGKAAHAGLDPKKGHSAITELAQQILEISKFTDMKRGITVNAGVIRGGTRTNVIAAEAEVEVDARIARLQDAAGLDRRFRALKPFDKQCTLEISGGINRPPLERTPSVAKLFAQAQALALEMDPAFKLKEAAVGGGSDGNFTAALGIPTLDGLGAVGDGAHAAHESVVIAELPRRTALLAGLIERI